MNDYSCWSFVEFYLMESAIYEMSTLPQEKQFLGSYQYLQRKIQSYHTPFTEAFALTLRDYLWFAAIGEARHSGRAVGEYITEMWDYLSSGRSSTYNDIARYYPPTAENKSVLHGLFADSCWGGSYGGDSWATIVESISLYDNLTPSAFIDHCADLQHNGGVAFDKGSVPFWNHEGYSMLMNFLSFKFNAPHLVFDIYDWNSKSSVGLSKWISREAVYIMNKLHAICRVHRSRLVPTKTIKYELEYSSPYVDDYTFSGVESGGGGCQCYECGDMGDEDYMHYCDSMGEYYCDYCVTSCECCSDMICGDPEYTDADGCALCYDCYSSEYTQCEHCCDLHPNCDVKEHEGYYYCESCYDDIVVECEECCEEFVEEDMHYEDGCYYCDDCYENRRCYVCDEIEDSVTVTDLDQYPHNKWLQPNCSIKMCTTCIKKHLDAGVDMWYSNIGIVMSTDIKEVLRYPYKGLLNVHLERRVVHEEFSNNIQGGTYYG